MQLATLLFAVGGEPSSKHYFMDKPLVTETCSADNRDLWDLPHVINNFSSSESAERHDDYILKLFCVVLPVGYCEVMFLCMSFFV